MEPKRRGRTKPSKPRHPRPRAQSRLVAETSQGERRRSARFVFITGLSGSGKTLVMKALEDSGFFCVDNLPLKLIGPFAELTAKGGERIESVAVVADIRERGFLKDFPGVYRRLRQRGFETTLLFLEARDDVLVRRFSESRRPHPLASGRAILDAVRAERRTLEPIRLLSDQILDTSEMTVHELRQQILERFAESAFRLVPALHVVSFGYKYGVPVDADLVFDVRFLPNPYFERNLRGKDGNDPEVEAFLWSHRESVEFQERLESFVGYLIPKYSQEGKSYLTIAIGCTGGRHRSVVVANRLARYINEHGQTARVTHRDVENE